MQRMHNGISTTPKDKQQQDWCGSFFERISHDVRVTQYDAMAVGQNQWYHFGVGEFTTHFSLS